MVLRPLQGLDGNFPLVSTTGTFCLVACFKDCNLQKKKIIKKKKGRYAQLYHKSNKTTKVCVVSYFQDDWVS